MKLAAVTTMIAFGILAPMQYAAADDDTRLIDLGISPYEPLYFVVGANGGLNAKFQLSFKYQIFSPTGWFTEHLHVPSNLYLSFSQTSIWDLDIASAPFRDSSYRPRLFFLKNDAWKSDGGSWRMNFEGGLAHESNGKAGNDSRSINLAYIKPTVSYYVNGTRRFYVAPMIYGYVDKAENPAISDYRGYADLVVGYGSGNIDNEDFNLWTTLRKGTKSNYGSAELNVAIPFKVLNGWLLAQYFTGYGESLLDYNVKRQAQFRAGFAFLVQ